MAVLKNEIPILEFDTEQGAVIMPGHHSDYNFPQKAVMLFMEPEIDDFVAENECEIVGKFVSVTKEFCVIPTAALRQEGTSYHYLPPLREIQLDAAPIKAICRVLENAGLSYRTCKTWTTDGFYRETKEMVRYRKSEGYSVVEMECASMAACAKMRGVLFGQVLFTADSLADVDAHDIRNWGNDFFATAMKIAMEAITEVQT